MTDWALFAFVLVCIGVRILRAQTAQTCQRAFKWPGCRCFDAGVIICGAIIMASWTNGCVARLADDRPVFYYYGATQPRCKRSMRAPPKRRLYGGLKPPEFVGTRLLLLVALGSSSDPGFL